MHEADHLKLTVSRARSGKSKWNQRSHECRVRGGNHPGGVAAVITAEDVESNGKRTAPARRRGTGTFFWQAKWFRHLTMAVGFSPSQDKLQRSSIFSIQRTIYVPALVVWLSAGLHSFAQQNFIAGTRLKETSGISESVSTIMARETASQRSPAIFRIRQVKPRFVPNRQSLPENTNAPTVSHWPVEGPNTIQTVGSTALLTPQVVGTSFLVAQISDTIGYVPPDSMADVGTNQIVVCVNGRIRTFTKNGVADGALNATTDNFFASVLGSSSTSDPRVRYDRLSGRWFITMITVSSPTNAVLIAVSSGSTITSSSSFTFFGFQADPSGFGDYDTLGVDANALYVGLNIFTSTFQNTTGFVIKKADLLNGTLTVTAFAGLISGHGIANKHGPYTPQGVNNDDLSATEGYFIGIDYGSGGTLVLRRVSNPAGTPTISGNINLTVPTTSSSLGSVPALGSTVNLDDVDNRLFAARMHDGSLWTAHNIEVNSSGVASSSGGRDGARWYEITNLTSTPTLVQSGTLYDSASSNPRNFWIPSCAMSGQGHMALGCSVAGNNEHAEIAAAGRLATDPLGTIQSPTTAVTTTSSYNVNDSSNPHRWGDYSVTTVDPSDDMTFWTVQEYCNANNSWGVRVIKLLAPPPALPVSCSPNTVTQGVANVSINLQGAVSSGSGFFDPGSGFPNHVSVVVNGGGVTVNSALYNSPTSLTLNVTVAANATTGPHTITVTNPDGQASTSSSGLLTVNATSQPPTITSPPLSQTIQCGSNASFTVSASGSTPLAYQWSLDGANLAGATSTNLSLTNVHLPDHLVTVVVTNLYGSATNTATLSVQDTLAPVISLAGANPLYVELGGTFTDPGAAAYDLCGGEVPVSVSGTVNTSVVGTNTLVYTATDGNGNTNTATRMAVVQDTTPPTILWSFTNLVLAAASNCVAIMPDVTGTNDIEATDLSLPLGTTQVPTNNALLPLGTNVVIISVADAYGNTSYSTNFIEVEDQTPPVVFSEPQSQTNYVGDNASFIFVADACTTLTFQWYFDTNTLVAQTNATLTLSNVTLAAAGEYYAVATAAGGSTTSAVVSLTVDLRPSSLALASSVNPSGFKAVLNFTANITPADATGTIQFLTNGSVFDSGPLDTGQVVSAGLSALPRGTNTVTAIYSGDGTYLPATNSLAQIVTNHPPVAIPAFYTLSTNLTLSIPLADLATNWSDLDGDTVSLASVSISTNGITLTNTGTALFYADSNNVADQFTCTISDGWGGTNFQTVFILPAALPDSTPLITGVTLTGNGGVQLTLGGAAGYTYVLETTTNLSGDWLAIATNTLATNDVWQFTDSEATNFSQRFYRLGLAP